MYYTLIGSRRVRKEKRAEKGRKKTGDVFTFTLHFRRPLTTALLLYYLIKPPPLLRVRRLIFIPILIGVLSGQDGTLIIIISLPGRS